MEGIRYPSEEVSALSVFYKDAAGDIYNTYSCYARGDEGGDAAYLYFDLTSKVAMRPMPPPPHPPCTPNLSHTPIADRWEGRCK